MQHVEDVAAVGDVQRARCAITCSPTTPAASDAVSLDLAPPSHAAVLPCDRVARAPASSSLF
jgi:hypothetical protein